MASYLAFNRRRKRNSFQVKIKIYTFPLTRSLTYRQQLKDFMKTNDIKNIDEKELIAEAKAGSQRAFAEIHRRYKAAIKMFAKKKLVGIVDSDDFTQDVFMKAFKALDKYEPKFKFSTWLLRISYNLMIDEYRKTGLDTVGMTFESDDEETTTMDFQDNLRNPLQVTEDNDRSAIIRAAIEEHLSHCQFKELVYARFFEQKALNDIAVEFGVPLGTVKAKLFRAEEILAKHLSKELLLA